jgi:choline dehydrogenase-like flavoprotein
MMYVRGSLQDYDDWAELAEDEGWSAENMQLYMRKHQVHIVNPILNKKFSSGFHW